MCKNVGPTIYTFYFFTYINALVYQCACRKKSVRLYVEDYVSRSWYISNLYKPHFTIACYGTTTKFCAGVSQKLVQLHTGHKSLEALHQYERPFEKQLLNVSNIMSNNNKGDSSATVVSISN